MPASVFIIDDCSIMSTSVTQLVLCFIQEPHSVLGDRRGIQPVKDMLPQ